MKNSHLFDTMADSSDRLQRSSVNRQQTSSSSKNAGRFPASQKSWRFLVSQSDLQCFSHEDGCFAAGNEMQGQPHLNCIITTSSPEFQSLCDFTKIRNWFTI